MPYPMLQGLFDGLLPPGLQWYWKGNFLKELSDEAIEIHRQFADIPTPYSTMHLYPVDSAAHDIDKNGTAWNNRDANWSMVIAGIDPGPENVDKIKTWTRDYWEALHPHTMAGA